MTTTVTLTLPEAIARAVAGHDLSVEEAKHVMDIIMSGGATEAQIGAWMTALRMKGETVEEITGCALAMRAHAHRIHPRASVLVDTCGTGGDGSGTFNISTAAAFVVAGAGVPVAKHGNRSVSSRCGSADVLEALGVEADVPPEEVERSIESIGIGFLFAPRFHQAMRYAVGPRREVAIRTIFNVLGPLTNPAGATAQVVGVYSPDLTEPMAEVLGRLGVKSALVVHGLDGLDEISLSAPTRVSHLQDGTVRTYTVHPEDAGLRPVAREALAGGNAATNAQIIEGIFQGEGGPRRDVVLLNAAAALTAAEAAADLKEGVALARDVIDSGKAGRILEQLREMAPRQTETGRERWAVHGRGNNSR